MPANEGIVRKELAGLLEIFPPVEFCGVYGSALHLNYNDKSAMVDYILGVSDPYEWHSENLKLNRHHYASWMAYLGGARLVTQVADKIGAGVHFNPFVTWNGRICKYGVVRMHDLIQDILNWESFYLSGRLQKPVHMLVDNLDIGNVNTVNLRAATSAALLLLPSKFSEEDLYVKICGLSYMGDLRMLFAEDRNKVKNIVRGQIDSFQKMYKPCLEEYAARDLLSFSSSGGCQASIYQDCGLTAVGTLVSSLPSTVRGRMGMKLGEIRRWTESGRMMNDVVVCSKEETAACLRKVVRNLVMVSSARQAVSGLLAVGGLNAAKYLARKMSKAWKSWI